MICANCKQEISYDQETVNFHLDEKCMEKVHWAKSARLCRILPDGSLEAIREVTFDISTDNPSVNISKEIHRAIEESHQAAKVYKASHSKKPCVDCGRLLIGGEWWEFRVRPTNETVWPLCEHDYMRRFAES